jgi:DNA-binding MarR family transcriptional regulator
MAKYNLDNSPAHLLRRATQFANDIYTREVGDDVLTARQFAVLLCVDQEEGLSQTDLVNKTGIDRSTLADMISRMLKKDLLRRKRTESDARANSVTITGSGKRALTTVLGRVEKAESKVLEPLPAGKRSDFLKMLMALAEGAGPTEAPAPKKASKAKAGKKRAAKKGKRK